MSFFPVGFDPRQDVIGVLNLVNINTPDGDFGFLLGQDGKFIDTAAKVWWGATVLEAPSLEMSINGVAPAGQIGMTFFQDPSLPDLVAQIRALGADYVRGRAITFFVQPLFAMSDLYTPQVAPIQLAKLEMRSISSSATGPMQRRLSLSYEGVFAGRNTARGWFYTTADHAKLTGSANPSLTFMPLDNRQEEKLF